MKLPKLPATWRFCQVNGKSPIGKNWPQRPYTALDIQRAFDAKDCTGYGLLLGIDNLLVVDIDGSNSLARILELCGGELPQTVSWTSGKRDRLNLLFRLSRPDSLRLFHQDNKGRVFEFWGTKGATDYEQLDFRYTGHQSVLPPSIHPETKLPYQWINAPADCEVTSAPEWLINHIENLIAKGNVEVGTEEKSSVPNAPAQAVPTASYSRHSTANQSDLKTDLVTLLEQDILPALSVRQIYTPYLKLTREGKELRGVCPLHPGADNPRSFCVDPTAKTWHCFACEAGGGPVQFLYQVKGGTGTCRGRDWVEIVKDLAARAGVSQPEKFGLAQLPLTQSHEVKDQKTGKEKEQKTQSEILIEIAIKQGVSFFHTPDGVGYADVYSDQHRVTYKLKGKDFKNWLGRQFYLLQKKPPASQSMQDVLDIFEGKAQFEGLEMAVYVRLANYDGTIYLDLGRPDWSAIAISPDGWQLVGEPSVRFRRPKGLLPLPVPEEGGSVSVLLEVLNIRPDDWPLVAAWLLFCFNPTNPKPILMLSGEKGSGKSSVARLLRRLIDPNKADLRQEPKDGRDLMIAASNGWVLAYDNLSRVPNDLSDALCRLATGGGFATRQLYENDEETILEATRPVILTGIEELASRSDLLDRMVLINLPTISEVDRQPESELEPELERLRPLVLGALLTAVAATLQKLPKVKPESLPRMADFARWGIAGEAALGLEPGSFIRAYQGNRERANETALEASPVAQAIQKLMKDQIPWKGTANELLATLCSQVDEQTKRSKAWPQTPKGLSSILQRLAPNLRAIGINITFDEERTVVRQISVG